MDVDVVTPRLPLSLSLSIYPSLSLSFPFPVSLDGCCSSLVVRAGPLENSGASVVPIHSCTVPDKALEPMNAARFLKNTGLAHVRKDYLMQ